MDTILEIHNLCKSYHDFSLKTINMTLEKGTLTGFVGPNGAGKTTTIKSILNIIKPDDGKNFLFWTSPHPALTLW